MGYDFTAIENKWQKYWDEHKTFHAENDYSKPKFYALVEFPYPSGQGLHIGHPRPYTAMDIVSRKRRLQGYNVLFPMGWDAFGLPTENFAIKNKIHPAIVTKNNVARFKAQLKSLGLSFDWDREINTTDPDYFKWTQWIFLKLFKAGLAYKKEMNVNWCTSCKVVLANEEVVHGFPSRRVVKEGDIVSVDVGARIHGFSGDGAGTYPCGEVSEEAKRLIEVTRQSFFEGIKFAKPGYRVSDIGHAIQEYVESHGFSVVRAYEGHGVGAKLHEEPEIPNFGEPGHGPRLVKGMTLAIEPMVNAGTWDVYVLDNDWTAVTADGKLSAHYENTILITDGEPEILTMAEDL